MVPLTSHKHRCDFNPWKNLVCSSTLRLKKKEGKIHGYTRSNPMLATYALHAVKGGETVSIIIDNSKKKLWTMCLPLMSGIFLFTISSECVCVCVWNIYIYRVLVRWFDIYRPIRIPWGDGKTCTVKEGSSIFCPLARSLALPPHDASLWMVCARCCCLLACLSACRCCGRSPAI